MFAQKIDCGYTLKPPRSTHNLCFGAKIRKIGKHVHALFFFYIKVGFKGVYISRTCFPDAYSFTDCQCLYLAFEPVVIISN